MVFKFDILFEKKLRSGSIKMVTYKQILENPDVFDGESLADAKGTLSTVRGGMEEGFSFYSILQKYRASLIGGSKDLGLSKGISTRFFFSNPCDPHSIQMQLHNPDSNCYEVPMSVPSYSCDIIVNDTNTGVICVICSEGRLLLVEGKSNIELAEGQLALCIVDSPVRVQAFNSIPFNFRVAVVKDLL